jgi:hypothetical protein
MVSPDAADVASLALDIETVAPLPTSLKIYPHTLRQYAPDAGDHIGLQRHGSILTMAALDAGLTPSRLLS